MTAAQNFGHAEQLAHYAAVRARLFNVKPRPANMNVRPIAPVAAVPAIDVARVPRLVMAPMWKLSPLQFNHHVILYRQYLLAKERENLEADYSAEPEKPSMTDIANEVLRDFPGVTLAELKGIHRKRDIVAARQLAMYHIRYRRPDLSYPVIGRFFGGRDHTTCIHAVQKIERMLAAADGPLKMEAAE